MSINAKFTAALDDLIEQVQKDRSILAAILCGSLSHDTVWAKSDIDLAFVTIDDKDANRDSLALYADGINVHTFLMTRTKFRALAEGSIRNSHHHSLLAKGRLLYSHDPTIADLFAGLEGIGERDRQMQLLHSATVALTLIYKAHKWMVTRGDLDYTALWIIYAATPLAQIELLGARRLIGREVIPEAMEINPEFFKIIYTDLLNKKKTQSAVDAALAAVDAYVADRTPQLFALVLNHLREVGEARTCTEIENHFTKSFGIGGVTTACEYLSDQGIIGKASIPVKLTKRSNVEVQELAFFSHD